MSTYFISDLHLSDHQPHLLKLFKYFIESILQPHDTLYILGDFFEYWIGDDQTSHVVNHTKQVLKTLARRQIQWYFLAGNRDFLLGKKFLAETHGELLAEKTVVSLGAHRVLLLHGDTLCTNDLAYQAWRRKVQQKWLQKLFLILPLSWRQSIANRMRQKSMMQGQQLTLDMMDVEEKAVQEDLNAYQVNTMIHGHVHRPGIHIFRNEQGLSFTRYVLADWGTMGNFLRYDGQQFDLVYFNLDSNEKKYDFKKT
jgi:UDP-2,3-diacylglucosamine hydrolase